MIDFSGLDQSRPVPALKITASIPENWTILPVQTRSLYTHQQWRAPSHNTGVGVAYLHLPIPLSARLLIWFAKLQYAQQNSSDGKPQGTLLSQWTDSLGREWFQAENEKYHIQGYALTNGFDAWVVYSGYRIRSPINPNELSLAARSMDSILPISLKDTP